MELIRGLQNLRAQHRGCVLTIGNFDGMHRGHQALVQRTLQIAGRLGLPAAAMTFEPTPREYFRRADAPPRVQTLRSKLDSLAHSGLQRVVIARFSQALSTMSAETFVDDLLVRQLGVAAVVVGHDFRYGRQRSGDEAHLRAAAAAHGFELSVGDLLGRPYTVLGRVRRGLQLGRQLGMPTANIDLVRPLAVRQGVYAVRARIDGGPAWDGVASLGIRPTIGITRCLLETHLFGQPGDIYGRQLEVEFVAWLRPELKFASLDELSARMQQDADDARGILARNPQQNPSATT